MIRNPNSDFGAWGTTNLANQRKIAGRTATFIGDYVQSIRWPTKWGDGDGWLVNYVGHPIHGAAAGRIWLNHDQAAVGVDLSATRKYLLSRAKAAQWSAVYSIQFEIGPLSEASLGNVGRDRSRLGWVDHVMTPVGAFGVLIAEDAVDKHVVQRLESSTSNAVLRAVTRVALNPARAMANLAGGRPPWHRIDRPLR